MRLAYACFLVWFVIGVGHPPSSFRWLPWFIGMLLAASSLALLRLTGVRFARPPARHIADREIRRQFARDLVWLPPR
jgi:glycerol uptake facilitator-like aquaporin